MKQSPQRTAELVALVTGRAQRARITVTGTSMEPLLSAGMVIEVSPLLALPRIGDILVFQSQRGLVAHRLVGGELFSYRAHSGLTAKRLRDPDSQTFITCGDAHPNRPETVPSHLVVGRVTTIWADSAPNARRIDDLRYHQLGLFFARTRRLRSLISKAQAYATLLLADPARNAGPAAFAALVAATHHFESRRYAEGLERLCSVAPTDIIQISRRHHMSGIIAQWLGDASRAGVDIPSDLREAFRRLRLSNALQASRVLFCVQHVRDTFAAAAIPHIFLKGGARLAAGLAGADLQFAGDVDVIVPQDMADRALAALRAMRYRDIRLAHQRDEYADSHQREPLLSPYVDVPVEVHVTLARPAVVSQRLDYTALTASSHIVDGPIGPVCVLDPVASAVHLAYHARDLRVWRDIVLVSRLFRDFRGSDRNRFDAFIRCESKDAVRLRSAVSTADSIAFDTPVTNRRAKRYISWAEVREDLPRRFLNVDLVEALIGQCLIPTLQFSHARRNFTEWWRIWLRNLILLPLIVRTLRWRHVEALNRTSLKRS